MPTIEAENLLFLNDSLEYIKGSGGLSETSPRRIDFFPEFQITITSTGFNRNLNIQIPTISEINWTIPAISKNWTNRDITVLGFLLGLAPLRYDPAPRDERFPLPSDFISAMVKQISGASGWNEDVDLFASELVSKLGIQFRVFDTNVNRQFGGGYEAELFKKRYKSLAADDIVNRERIVSWSGLPAVASDHAALVTRPANLESALTWSQSGLVSPSLVVPNTNHNQLIQSNDTALSVITPEVRIPVGLRSSRKPSVMFVEPHESIKVFETSVNNEIGWIERTVTEEFVNRLRRKSPEVDAAFVSGDLKVEQGKLIFHFQGSEPAGVTFLSLVPAGGNPEPVKEVLLVGANDVLQIAG